MATIELTLPKLHTGQRAIVEASAKNNVVCCGRRFGKTTLALDRLVHKALEGQPVGWFAPNRLYYKPIWRQAKELLKPIAVEVSEQDRQIRLITGAEVDFWTMDGPNPGLGRKYALVVVDEAAICRDFSHLWEVAITPTLADLDGESWICSTPRGYNYFHSLALLGKDPTVDDWAFHTAPTRANPFLKNIDGYLARKKATVTADRFTQEYEAEFLRGGGATFRLVDEAATATAQTGRIEGHQYVFGLDFGRSNDYTVVSVIDITTSEQVAIDRYTGIEFVQQQNRIKALADRFQPDTMVCEANSFGQANIEALRRMDLPISSFTTTQGTKAKLVDDLTLAFEQRTIKILPDPVQKGEILAYEGTQSRNGLMSYSAPNGIHDDCVMALMLAYSAASKGKTRAVEFSW